MTITIERRISEAEQRIADLTAQAFEARTRREVKLACELESRVEALAAFCERSRAFCG